LSPEYGLSKGSIPHARENIEAGLIRAHEVALPIHVEIIGRDRHWVADVSNRGSAGEAGTGTELPGAVSEEDGHVIKIGNRQVLMTIAVEIRGSR